MFETHSLLMLSCACGEKSAPTGLCQLVQDETSMIVFRMNRVMDIFVCVFRVKEESVFLTLRFDNQDRHM